MSGVEELVAGPGGPAREVRHPRLVAVRATVWTFLRTLADRVLGDPVRNGRPRDVGWPLGLRPVLALSALMCLVAAGLALLSTPLRGSLRLVMIPGIEAAVPRPVVWLLLIMLALVLALVQTAALHAPWWFRFLGTALSLAVVGFWTLSGIGLADDLFAARLVVAGVLVVGLIVLAAIRSRRRFAWWEFPLVFAVLSAGLIAGARFSGAGGISVALGYDQVPTMTAGSLRTLGVLAIPVLIAAGLSVAEVTVSGAVWAGRLGVRFTRRRWGYLILLIVAALRLVQIGWQLVHWDPVADGPLVIATTVITAALMAAVSLVVIRIARRARTDAGELPELANRLALPVGVGLTALLVPVLVLTAVVGVLSLVSPSETLVAAQDAISAGSVFSAVRVLLGLVLLVLAIRHARRGALGSALLLGTTGVMLVAIAARFLTGGLIPTGLDTDVLNLIGASAVIVLALVLLARRALTPSRAITLAAALVLSSLFSFRNFVSDPIGLVFGVSGVGLVIFGVIWDLLTGSEWANRRGGRLPVSSRMLLIMAKTLLGLTIVAFAALTRNPDAAIDPDAYSELGDFVLGTALVAAAFVVIIRSVVRDAADDPEPVGTSLSEPEPTGPAAAAGPRASSTDG